MRWWCNTQWWYSETAWLAGWPGWDSTDLKFLGGNTHTTPVEDSSTFFFQKQQGILSFETALIIKAIQEIQAPTPHVVHDRGNETYNNTVWDCYPLPICYVVLICDLAIHHHDIRKNGYFTIHGYGSYKHPSSEHHYVVMIIYIYWPEGLSPMQLSQQTTRAIDIVCNLKIFPVVYKQHTPMNALWEKSCFFDFWWYSTSLVKTEATWISKPQNPTRKV